MNKMQNRTVKDLNEDAGEIDSIIGETPDHNLGTQAALDRENMFLILW